MKCPIPNLAMFLNRQFDDLAVLRGKTTLCFLQLGSRRFAENLIRRLNAANAPFLPTAFIPGQPRSASRPGDKVSHRIARIESFARHFNSPYKHEAPASVSNVLTSRRFTQPPGRFTY